MTKDQQALLVQELNITAEALKLATAVIAANETINKQFQTAGQIEADLLRKAKRRVEEPRAAPPPPPDPPPAPALPQYKGPANGWGGQVTG
jgi:hypothetical protein